MTERSDAPWGLWNWHDYEGGGFRHLWRNKPSLDTLKAVGFKTKDARRLLEKGDLRTPGTDYELKQIEFEDD